MRKIIACLLVVVLLLAGTSTVTFAGQGRGGLVGFIVGCCFGIRTGGDYNQGKEIHWREWVMLVPIVNLVFFIWLVFAMPHVHGRTRWWGAALLFLPLIGLYWYALTLDDLRRSPALAT